MCDAVTAQEPARGYDYLEGRASQSADISDHGRGTLPTGGLPSAAPRTRSSVPVDSRASTVLPRDTVPEVVEHVGEGFRYPERAWQQVLSLGPQLPQFINCAALVEGAQAGTAPDQCARPTLQAGNPGKNEERRQDDLTMDPGLPDHHGTSSAGHSSTFHRVGGGDLPPSVPATTFVGIGVKHDVPSSSTGLKWNDKGVSIAIGTYNGSTCLETFLASVKNSSLYIQWSAEDELFCLRASLCGPAGQLLWDLGPQITLAGLLRLL